MGLPKSTLTRNLKSCGFRSIFKKISNHRILNGLRCVAQRRSLGAGLEGFEEQRSLGDEVRRDQPRSVLRDLHQLQPGAGGKFLQIVTAGRTTSELKDSARSDRQGTYLHGSTEVRY